jgi:uncharacterized protein (TIGR00297 family)
MMSPFPDVLTQSAPVWAAFGGAAAVSFVAWRSGNLRLDGAAAAFGIGVAALLVQWSWGVFLIVWFGLSTALSRFGRVTKAERTKAVVQKGGQRDAIQVLANGGVFGVCALLALQSPALSATVSIAAAGALVAAGADTWSTEIGTLFGGDPWSLRTRARAAAGSSGAVTWQGSLGGAVGAAVFAVIALGLHMVGRSHFMPILLGGIAGATADTIFGAWLQERRQCPLCGGETERLTHCEGVSTTHAGGVSRINNDVVNVVCALVGALVAMALATRGASQS